MDDERSDPSADYPLGGSLEPHDIEVERELCAEHDCHKGPEDACPVCDAA